MTILYYDKSKIVSPRLKVGVGGYLSGSDFQPHFNRCKEDIFAIREAQKYKLRYLPGKNIKSVVADEYV